MLIKADFLVRCRRTGRVASGAVFVAALLCACTLVPPAPVVQPAAPAAPEAASPAASSPAPAAPAPLAGAAPLPESYPVVRALAYADRIRNLSAAELGQEVARLGSIYMPVSQLQLAIALAQLRQTPELVRAQEVLTRLLANPDAEAQALHPLARLLALRFGEQRRVEDLLDKQNVQTREVQRRLDQTNERLEALKAI
ncbi:MAG: hypothetical protein JWR74_3103 [Polaromonas sp.]|nr:hypothetical protein [Polaromonas sp.]